MKHCQKALTILAIILACLIILTIIFNTPIKKVGCEVMPKDGFMGDCPEANCYYKLALDKKDPHICELIQPGRGGAKGSCANPSRCLGKFGLPYMYVEACFKNSDHCYSDVNAAEMCSEAKTETGKTYCYERLEEKQETPKEKIYKQALTSSNVNDCFAIYTQQTEMKRTQIEWSTDKIREINCVTKKALEKNSIETCNLLTPTKYGSNDYIHNCILQLAINNNNESMCKLTDAFHTEYCERDFTWAKAITELDVEQCPKKNLTLIKKNEFGGIIQNTTIELIEKTTCAMEIAKKTRDVTICKRMNREGEISGYGPSQDCVVNIALETEDKTYCDLIDDFHFYKKLCKQKINEKIN